MDVEANTVDVEANTVDVEVNTVDVEANTEAEELADSTNKYIERSRFVNDFNFKSEEFN